MTPAARKPRATTTKPAAKKPTTARKTAAKPAATTRKTPARKAAPKQEPLPTRPTEPQTIGDVTVTPRDDNINVRWACTTRTFTKENMRAIIGYIEDFSVRRHIWLDLTEISGGRPLFVMVREDGQITANTHLGVYTWVSWANLRQALEAVLD